MLAFESSNEIVSRLSSLNGWRSKWCPQNNIEFIDNWKSFWGRPVLLKRDGIHPSWSILLIIVSHSLEYLLQNYEKIFLTTHSDNTIKSFLNFLTCFGQNRFVRGGVNHPLGKGKFIYIAHFIHNGNSK